MTDPLAGLHKARAELQEQLDRVERAIKVLDPPPRKRRRRRRKPKS